MKLVTPQGCLFTESRVGLKNLNFKPVPQVIGGRPKELLNHTGVWVWPHTHPFRTWSPECVLLHRGIQHTANFWTHCHSNYFIKNKYIIQTFPFVFPPFRGSHHCLKIKAHSCRHRDPGEKLTCTPAAEILKEK